MRIVKTVLALALTFGITATAAADDDAFTFVAFADTAYEPPGDYALYEKLLAAINAAKPSFSMHLGDTKGYGPCDEEAQARQRDFFNTLEAPLVYAPGNNEWSECWRPEMGGADPVETLAVLRKVFYPDGFSLGKARMALEREAAGEDYGATPENAMWEKNGILFVTLNVTGSGNNLVNLNEKTFAEFLSRDKANQAWIERAFAKAEVESLKGVVFAFHSSLWLGTADYRAGPFERVINALQKGASETDTQVLIINGHAHALIVDKPWQSWDNAAKTVAFGNVTRLQVPGWPEHRAVEVTVEPATPGLWSFREIYDPDNLSAEFRKNQ